MSLKQVIVYTPGQLNRMVASDVLELPGPDKPADYCQDAAAWKTLVDAIAGPDAELFMKITLHYESDAGVWVHLDQKGWSDGRPLHTAHHQNLFVATCIAALKTVGIQAVIADQFVLS